MLSSPRLSELSWSSKCCDETVVIVILVMMNVLAMLRCDDSVDFNPGFGVVRCCSKTLLKDGDV